MTETTKFPTVNDQDELQNLVMDFIDGVLEPRQRPEEGAFWARNACRNLKDHYSGVWEDLPPDPPVVDPSPVIHDVDTSNTDSRIANF